MSPFKCLRVACGLSQIDAATFLNVSEDSVRSWDKGRRTPSADVIETLEELCRAIRRAADQAIALIHSQPNTIISLGYPADNYEAKALGLPTVSCWQVMAGMVMSAIDQPVELVPRGSTPVTAAAVDAHGK